MKKTLFSALAVCAVVSAALAFAPAKQHADIFTNDPTTGKCTFLTQYKEDPAGSTTLSGPYSKISDINNPCPTNQFQATLDQ